GSQVGFPAFVAALIDWVAPRATRSLGPCVVGVACTLPLSAASEDARLVDPAGALVPHLDLLRPVVGDPLASGVWNPTLFDVSLTPDRSGAYSLEGGGVTYSLPVTVVPVGTQPTGESGAPVEGALQ